jgi:hypothetical protein
MEDLDSVLDAALKAYSDEPAPLGMEGRILRRVHEPKARHRQYVWRFWIPAAAVLAAAAILLFVLPRRTAYPIQRPRHTVTPQVVAHVAPAPPPPRARHRRRSTVARPTRQQLLLATFVREHPQEALDMITHEELKPLEVTPLVIQKLKIEELPK